MEPNYAVERDWVRALYPDGKIDWQEEFLRLLSVVKQAIPCIENMNAAVGLLHTASRCGDVLSEYAEDKVLAMFMPAQTKTVLRYFRNFRPTPYVGLNAAGDITIGDHLRIGADLVVYHDVLPMSRPCDNLADATLQAMLAYTRWVYVQVHDHQEQP